jgi:hypothetical protein
MIVLKSSTSVPVVKWALGQIECHVCRMMRGENLNPSAAYGVYDYGVYDIERCTAASDAASADKA